MKGTEKTRRDREVGKKRKEEGKDVKIGFGRLIDNNELGIELEEGLLVSKIKNRKADLI